MILPIAAVPAIALLTIAASIPIPRRRDEPAGNAVNEDAHNLRRSRARRISMQEGAAGATIPR
jgi:hypothetical protein